MSTKEGNVVHSLTEKESQFLAAVFASIEGPLKIDMSNVATLTGYDKTASASKQWSRLSARLGIKPGGGSSPASGTKKTGSVGVKRKADAEDGTPTPGPKKKMVATPSSRGKKTPKNAYKASDNKASDDDTEEKVHVKGEDD